MDIRHIRISQSDLTAFAQHHKAFVSLDNLSFNDYLLIMNRIYDIQQGEYRECLRDRYEVRPIVSKAPSLSMIDFVAMVKRLSGELSYFPFFMYPENEGADEYNARNLGRRASCLVFQGHDQNAVEIYGRSSGIPVINVSSDEFHPIQILSDIYTLLEYVCMHDLTNLSTFRIAYFGRPNDITNTLLQACPILNIGLEVCYPMRKVDSSSQFERYMTHVTQEHPDFQFRLTRDPSECIERCQIIYTDRWINEEEERRLSDTEKTSLLKAMKPYQINSKLLVKASGPRYFLHANPPDERGEREISKEVLTNPQLRSLSDQRDNNYQWVCGALLSLLV